MPRTTVDLQQLRHFVALAEHRNFTRAAEASFITQSAFSRSIQALEHNLGCQLVERSTGGRGVTLTEHGQALQRRAREIVASVSNLRADISALERQPPPLLTFGSGPLPAAGLIPAALGAFIEANADTLVQTYVDNPEVLKARLDNGEIEFLVADLRYVETSKGYVSRALRPRRFELFCRPHHPLLGAQAPFAALADYPLGGASLSKELLILLSERAGRARLPLNVNVLHSDMLVQMVMCSDLVGIAPEDIVAYRVRRGDIERLHLRDTPQELKLGGTCFGVVHRADRPLSPRAERLIEFIGRIDAGFAPGDENLARTYGLAV